MGRLIDEAIKKNPMDRTRAIDILEEEIKTSESFSGDLEYVMYKSINHIKHHTSEEFREAARLAIASLRTDEYYELMSEDVEIYTKADMVSMLTDLQLEIEKMSGLCSEIHGDEWNEINIVHSQDVLSLIQQKIDKLKEDGESE